MSIVPDKRLILSIANTEERKKIYEFRHKIYAEELGQHEVNTVNIIKDELDLVNHYVIAKYSNEIVGFISITAPSSKKYSVDKYFDRAIIPFHFDENLFEIRLLTVLKKNRNSIIALALMYAAFRWVQSHGGKHIIAICRVELLEMYRKAGLKTLNQRVKSGKLNYELSYASTDDLQLLLENNIEIYKSLESKLDWQLPYQYHSPTACYHGGSFFKAIGEDLQTLIKAKEIINADVLDAWFNPSPKVLYAIQENLAWLTKTSPPTHAEGLIKTIAEIRGVNENNILPGAGSSDLIFLALRNILNKNSTVLIIDPCYGEYIHVLEKVIQCNVTRFNLNRKEGFLINTSLLLLEIEKGYDMVIIVNPNSPTGVYVHKNEMEAMLSQIPASTIVWVDETYIDYVDSRYSLEKFAAKSENIMICKSMSKVYALSGARAAYICSSPHLIEKLIHISPPWSVSLIAQAAAIAALKDQEYYTEKFQETHQLRNTLKKDLLELGITELIEGVANFLLFYLPSHFPPAEEFIESCKLKNLFIRNVSNMGNNLGKSAVRIAVKDDQTNKRMIDIIKFVVNTHHEKTINT